MRVSVLTPTWNREKLLVRVWEGLQLQSFDSFEWIVSNDGSDDNTAILIRELAKRSKFPITLINASTRVGKSRMDNEAVKAANGEFSIWCDSDDCLYPNAIKDMVDAWDQLPSSQRQDHLGVAALNEADDGVLGRDFPKSQVHNISLNNLMQMMKSDLAILSKTKVLKENPFLEVDFLIPESSMWARIGHMKVVFLPQLVQRRYYRQPNALSFTGKLEYNRGRAYSAAVTTPILRDHFTFTELFLLSVNYMRYCIHADFGVPFAFHLWKQYKGNIFWLFLALPLAVSLACRDRLKGKVRKTHRDFDVARNIVVIDIERLL